MTAKSDDTPPLPVPAPLPAVRLIQVHFIGPPLPEALGNLGSVTCKTPGKLRGWSISLRGAAVFLISPPGHVAGSRPDPTSKRRRVVEMPRTDVRFSWDVDDPGVIEKLTRHDTGPLGVEAAAEQPADG